MDDTKSIDGSARPLMVLLQGLVDMVDIKRSKKLKLTKAKTLDMLKEEFDIDISQLHKLEVDIYINVVQRFLKDWPEWDKFDRSVTQMKQRKRVKVNFKSFLNSKYASLIAYLKAMLETVKPMAKEAVQNYELENAPKVKTEENSPDDVVLEIRCTRAQLNKLVFNHPGKNTVFNYAAGDTPSKTVVGTVSLQGLFNWHKVALVINLPKFSYKRRINHDMKHILMNKKLKHTAEVVELNRCLQKKEINGKVAAAQVETLLKMVMILADRERKKNKPSALKEVLDLFYKVIKQDLSCAPSELQVPSTHRRYMNKYPYVRYLYTDIKAEEGTEEAQKYDLQLQETISPQYQFWLIRADTDMLDTSKMLAKTLAELSDRIFIKCEECDLKFHCNELYKFQCHMMVKHQPNEPDLQCTNCDKVFTVNELADQYWHHRC